MKPSTSVGISAKGPTTKRTHHSHGFLTANSRSTTRHLAALDFLLNIPMANESKIRETGIENASRIRQMEGDGANDEESVDQEKLKSASSSNLQALTFTDDHMANTLDTVGRKHPGVPAPTVRFLPQYRHNMLRTNEQSAEIRKWEDHLISQGPRLVSPRGVGPSVPLLASRMFYSRARAYPVGICSVIKYDAGEEKARRAKLRAEDKKGLEVFELPKRDWRGFSYKPLFRPLAEERATDYYYERGYMYDPNALDDPEMLHGAHRHFLHPGAATGPIMSSIILYVNKKELKQSLNEQFRERHPQLPPSLTISKIRNLKKSALLGCLELSIDIATTALAVIYFERLCLKSLVTKANRHLTMAVSLLLAYKFNEPVEEDYHSRLAALLDFMDRNWEVSRKQVFDAEFGAFVHLGFSLHVPHQHVFVVFNRLLKLVYRSNRNYLGDDMMEVYTQDVIAYERERELERSKEIEREQAELAKKEQEEAALQYQEEVDRLKREEDAVREREREKSKDRDKDRERDREKEKDKEKDRERGRERATLEEQSTDTPTPRSYQTSDDDWGGQSNTTVVGSQTSGNDEEKHKNEREEEEQRNVRSKQRKKLFL